MQAENDNETNAKTEITPVNSIKEKSKSGQGDHKKTRVHRSSSSRLHRAESSKDSTDKVKQLLEESSAKLSKTGKLHHSAEDKHSGSDSSRDSYHGSRGGQGHHMSDSSHYRGSHPVVMSLKEESSDESTIISSQTSTLTRNHGMYYCQTQNIRPLVKNFCFNRF